MLSATTSSSIITEHKNYRTGCIVHIAENKSPVGIQK